MTEDAVCESMLDGPYKVMVLRTGPYRREWSIHCADQVLDRQDEGLSYDALLGPDVADVADWQERAIQVVDGLGTS